MSVSTARSRVAHESKKQKQSGKVEPTPALVEARRDLAAAKLEAYIQRVVDEAPELTAEQKSRLALLLKAGHR